MLKQLKCKDVGCDKCTKGLYGGKDGFGGKLYYCQVRQSIIPVENAKDCNLFRCDNPDNYSCRTCGRGK